MFADKVCWRTFCEAWWCRPEFFIAWSSITEGATVRLAMRRRLFRHTWVPAFSSEAVALDPICFLVCPVQTSIFQALRILPIRSMHRLATQVCGLVPRLQQTRVARGSQVRSHHTPLGASREACWDESCRLERSCDPPDVKFNLMTNTEGCQLAYLNQQFKVPSASAFKCKRTRHASR